MTVVRLEVKKLSHSDSARSSFNRLLCVLSHALFWARGVEQCCRRNKPAETEGLIEEKTEVP